MKETKKIIAERLVAFNKFHIDEKPIMYKRYMRMLKSKLIELEAKVVAERIEQKKLLHPDRSYPVDTKLILDYVKINKTQKKILKEFVVIDDNFVEFNNSLENAVQEFRYNIKNKKIIPVEYKDNKLILNKLEPLLTNKIKSMTLVKSIKWRLTINIVYHKITKDGDEIITTQLHHSNAVESKHNELMETIKNKYEVACDKINDYVEHSISEKGSGFTIEKINYVGLKIVSVVSIAGSSYFKNSLIESCKSVLNIQNKDQKCFLWCIAAHLHPTDKGHPYRTSRYKDYINDFVVDGIEFPVKVSDVPKFERMNNLSINVFGIEKGLLIINYISKDSENAIDLLLLQDPTTLNTHYVLITKFNSFQIGKNCNEKRNYTYRCKRCLTYTTRSPESYKTHLEDCGKVDPCRTVLPKPGTTLTFKSYDKMLKIPFVIYYDFESTLKPFVDITDCNTKKIAKHLPNSFAIRTICIDSRYNYSVHSKIYSDHIECTRDFINIILSEEKRIREIKKEIVPMSLTDEEQDNYRQCNTCHICRNAINQKYKSFTINGDFIGASCVSCVKHKKGKMTKETETKFKKSNTCVTCNVPITMKVRDHCHITGKFRGPACSNCNLHLKCKSSIPVIAHNSRGYDTHLFIKQISKLINPNEQILTVIPNNKEKYLTFGIAKAKTAKENYATINFIDSFGFLATSLDKLATNMNKCDFKYTKENFSDDLFDIAIKKGLYPYEWVDSNEKFLVEEFPPIEAFNSSLYGYQIGDGDYVNIKIDKNTYNNAKHVYKTLKCKTFKDYHDYYLKVDVLLLTDIFETFRNLMIERYQLDPLHFITLPGLSWSAMMLNTDVKLELISDNDMLLFIEKGIRGGISMVSHRYAKQTNDSLMRYWDANNLYGWAMCEYLPIGGHKWNTEEWNIERINSIGKEDVEVRTGYLFEVDISVPNELKEYFRKYPMCPEHYVVKDSDLSEYQKSFNCKLSKESKLICNLHAKTKYVIHYKNLQQCIKYGMKLDKVHRVLEFKESKFLEPYILKNTDYRKSAKSDFEKDLYKLMNNAVYGKTMENVRNRINFTLVTSKKQHIKLASKINYKDSDIFDENLVGVSMIKTKVVMDKPIYVGQAILDLSKTLMYDFHYGFMTDNFTNFELCLTDTDSFIYKINTSIDNFNKIISDNIDKFDTSNYVENHLLYSKTNEKVIGKFKSETGDIEIDEFVGLRSKMYSYSLSTKSHCKAKGVKKCVVNQFNVNNYKNVLNTRNNLNVKMQTFRSYKHDIYTIEQTKVGLSCYDDKNYIEPDGITTRPFGFYE